MFYQIVWSMLTRLLIVLYDTTCTAISFALQTHKKIAYPCMTLFDLISHLHAMRKKEREQRCNTHVRSALCARVLQRVTCVWFFVIFHVSSFNYNTCRFMFWRWSVTITSNLKKNINWLKHIKCTHRIMIGLLAINLWERATFNNAYCLHGPSQCYFQLTVFILHFDDFRFFDILFVDVTFDQLKSHRNLSLMILKMVQISRLKGRGYWKIPMTSVWL